MNKKRKWLLLIPIVLVLCFIIFKSCALFYYYTYPHDISSIKFGEKAIQTDESLANVKFKNLNIYIPDGMGEKKYENNDIYSYHSVNVEDVNNEKSTKYMSIYTHGNCDDFSDYKEARIKDGKKLMQKNGFKNKYDFLSIIIII